LAIWGIGQSVITAAVITVIEIIGLILIVWVTRSDLATFPVRLNEFNPGLNSAMWLGILSGSFLAFYAFIGFEDMVNVAEEVVDVENNLPKAIIITLILTTLIYCLVTLAAVLTVPPEQLGQQSAPLTYIYAAKTGSDATLISLISILAIVNGALIQMIMASRVLYGMSRQSMIPAQLNFMAEINPRTQTPIKATLLVMLLVSVLALSYAIESLAETTSLMILVIAVVVNTALVQIKLRAEEQPEKKGIRVPIAVPITGLIISFGFAIMIAIDLIK
jgi:APA family basic amino acid/polyamine antiporter